jgi:hypothetical protein
MIHGGAQFLHRTPAIPNRLSAKLSWKRAEEARVLDRSAAPIRNQGLAVHGGNAAQILGKTFRDVADTFLASQEAGRHDPKHRQQRGHILYTHAHPILGAVPAAEVATRWCSPARARGAR